MYITWETQWKERNMIVNSVGKAIEYDENKGAEVVSVIEFKHNEEKEYSVTWLTGPVTLMNKEQVEKMYPEEIKVIDKIASELDEKGHVKCVRCGTWVRTDWCCQECGYPTY